MMKHGGRFLSPCSFFAKQLKSTDRTDDTDSSLRFLFNILVKTSTENAREHLASGENFIMDRIGDARIFGAARAENKSQNLFFAESRQK